MADKEEFAQRAFAKMRARDAVRSDDELRAKIAEMMAGMERRAMVPIEWGEAEIIDG